MHLCHAVPACVLALGAVPGHPDVQQDSQTQRVRVGLSCHKVPVFQSRSCSVSLPSECFAGLFSPLSVPSEALLLLSVD